MRLTRVAAFGVYCRREAVAPNPAVKLMCTGGARLCSHRAPSAAAARAKTGLSQQDFSNLLGVSMRTLQDWEQGRREPTGAAKTLLRVATTHPEILLNLRQ